MADPRKQIGERFEKQPFQNFGNIIRKMVVRGVRCHTDTVINILNPITAISGLNGTGKSTLLQLAASAYRGEQALTGRPFSVSDFIVRGALDARPFREDAAIEYTFETTKDEDGKQVSAKNLTISYSSQDQRWEGYDRRPKRNVFFGGIGMFLPRSERPNDYVFQNAERMKVAETVELAEEVRTWSARILNCGYEKIAKNHLKYRTRQEHVLSTQSNGNDYSESHMGCGEGRVQSMLAQLESLPPQSLILLEEPETALHPDAEYNLGTYLIDLCNRKSHQIFITTHSHMLLRSLPPKSLIYLHRENGKVEAIAGLSSAQASSLMAQGYEKALTILVEDRAAEIVLYEILRHFDNAFARTVGIVIAGSIGADGRPKAGGKDAIRNTLISLSRATHFNIAAVLDGGELADPKHYIFKLPGDFPPEAALFQCPAVREFLDRNYQELDMKAIETEFENADCHDYFKRLGRIVGCEEDFLIRESARCYAPQAGATEVKALVDLLKDAASKNTRRNPS